MSYQQEKFREIADKIRERTNTSDPIVPNNFASKIDDVWTNGYDSGLATGEAKGMQQQQTLWWDTYFDTALDSSVNGGSRMFAGTGWNAYTFYPTRSIPIDQLSVFTYFAWQSSKDYRLDLTKRLKEQSDRLGYEIKLDDSKGVGSGCFSFGWFTRVPKIKPQANLAQMYRGCRYLMTIDGIELPESNTFTFTQTFDDCRVLANITITGTIARTVDFSACPLTPASMKSIIKALADYSTTDTFKYSVSFTATCWSKLEADSTPMDEGIDFDGTWEAYVQSKGWLT